MSKADEAAASFSGGLNCAQAVLATYCEALGMDKAAACRMACGMGAGMGRLGGTCGAVSGAYMLIGLKHGNSAPDGGKAKEKAYEAVRQFAKAFEQRNGSTQCRELLGLDLLAADKEAIAERVKSVCPKAVRDASEIVEAMLNLS